MKKILAIDLDGTILDIKPKYCKVFCELTGNGYEESEVFWDRKRTWESSFRIAVDLSPNLNKSNSEFTQSWIDEIEKIENLSLDKLYSNVARKLIELRENYYTILCTKRRNTNNLKLQLIDLGIINHFDRIITLNANEKKIEKIFSEMFPLTELILISDTPGDFEGDVPNLNVIKYGVCSGLSSTAAWNGIKDINVIQKFTDFRESP